MVNNLMSVDTQRILSDNNGYDEGILYHSSVEDKLVLTKPETRDLVAYIDTTPQLEKSFASVTSAKENTVEATDSAGEAMYFMNMTEEEIAKAKEELDFGKQIITDDDGVATKSITNAKEIITKAHTKATEIENSLPEVDSLTTLVTNLKSEVEVICEEIASTKKDIVSVPEYVTNLKSLYSKNDNAFANAYDSIKNADDYGLLKYFTNAKKLVAQAYTDIKPDDAHTALIDLRSAITSTDSYITKALVDLKSAPTTLYNLKSYTTRSLDTLKNADDHITRADNYIRKESLTNLKSVESGFSSAKEKAYFTSENTFTDTELNEITTAMKDLCNSVESTDSSMMYAEQSITDVPPLANETKNNNLSSITTLNKALSDITNAKSIVTDDMVLGGMSDAAKSITTAKDKLVTLEDYIYTDEELDTTLQSITDKPLANALTELDKADKYITNIPDDATDDYKRYYLGLVLDRITTAEDYLEDGQFITKAQDSLKNLRNKTATIDLTDVFDDDDKTTVLSAGDYVEDLCKSITKITEYTTEYGITSKTYATKTREALEMALNHLATSERYIASGNATSMASIVNANNAITSAITKAETYEEIDVTEAYTAVTVAVANASGVCEAIEKAYTAVQQVTTYSKTSRTYAEKILTILEATLKRVELIETAFYSSSTPTTLLEYLTKAETTSIQTLTYIGTIDETAFKAEELETIKKYTETIRSAIVSAQDLIIELCEDGTEIGIDELESDSLSLKDALKELVDYITTVASNLLYVEENIKKSDESITSAKTATMSAHDKSVKAKQNTFEEKELADLKDTIGTAKDSVTDATESIGNATEHLSKAQSYSDGHVEQLTNAKSFMSEAIDDIDNADDYFQEDAGITYYSITSVPSDNLQEINLCDVTDDATDTSEYIKTVYFIPASEMDASALFAKLESQSTMSKETFSSTTSSVTSTYSSFSSSQSYTEQSYSSITSATEHLTSSKEQTEVTVDFSEDAAASVSFAQEAVEDEETGKSITNAKETTETTKEKAAHMSTDVGDTEEVTEQTNEIDELIDQLCTEIDAALESITNLPEYSYSSGWGSDATSAAHTYLTSMTNSVSTTMVHVQTAKSYVTELVSILSEKIASLKKVLTVAKKKTDIVYASIVTETEVTSTVTTVEKAREYVLTMCDGLTNAKKALEKAQENAKKAAESASEGLKDLKSASESMQKADSALRNESGAPLYDLSLAQDAVNELKELASKTLTPAYDYDDLTNTLMSVSKAEMALAYAKDNTYTITMAEDKHEYHMLIDKNGSYNIIENNAAQLLRKYDPKLGVITDPDGTVLLKLSKEEPGPGSDDLSSFSAYTYRQLVGLNGDMADVCTNVNRVAKPSLPDAPPSDGNYALKFKNQDFEYLVLRSDNLYHLFKNNTYYLTYELHKDANGQYTLNEQHWQKINGEWQNTTTAQGKYTLSRENRSDGKLSYWKLAKPGNSTPLAALTPPMKLSDSYEDCEERTKKLYGKNNNKTSTIANAQGTTFTSTSVVNNAAKVNTTTEVATTTKTATQQSKTNTWSWSTASTTLASMGSSSSTSSLKSLIMSDTKPATTWSWAKDITISSYLSGSGESSSKSSEKSDSSAVDTVVEKGKQALGAVSNLLDKIIAFFTKDEETASGENLKKDEPLTVPDTNKETKALASSMSGMPPMSQNGIREGIIYSQSLERQKVSYGKGRQAYQAEHKKSNKVRKRRAQYKSKKMMYTITSGSGRGEQLSNITNSTSQPVVDFSTA